MDDIAKRIRILASELDDAADKGDVKNHMRLHDLASYARQIASDVQIEAKKAYEATWDFTFAQWKLSFIRLWRKLKSKGEKVKHYGYDK